MMIEGALFFVLSLEIALEIEAELKEAELDEALWSGKPS